MKLLITLCLITLAMAYSPQEEQLQKAYKAGYMAAQQQEAELWGWGDVTHWVKGAEKTASHDAHNAEKDARVAAQEAERAAATAAAKAKVLAAKAKAELIKDAAKAKAELIKDAEKAKHWASGAKNTVSQAVANAMNAAAKAAVKAEKAAAHASSIAEKKVANVLAQNAKKAQAYANKVFHEAEATREAELWGWGAVTHWVHGAENTVSHAAQNAAKAARAEAQRVAQQAQYAENVLVNDLNKAQRAMTPLAKEALSKMKNFASAHKCQVISFVCNKVCGKGVSSLMSCTVDDGMVAGTCEAVGLGPEDPAADICAVSLGAAFEGLCYAAVRELGSFAGKMCTKAMGC